MILSEEGSSAVALANLGNGPIGSDPEPGVIFLERDTAFSEYFQTLDGDGSSLRSWIVWVDRYVSASDKGNRCIYCEKENNIAVLAVRDTLSKSTLLKLQHVLEARSIRAISDPTADHLFNFDKLVPSWRAALKAAYGR
jgi:hypothetical protein